ncbi:hypothetical protein EYF80_068382 [Liparis tanakae]|uniref:Uncharacterized protein n=1 Tax=Liparis tanakae TaxID=230148 RepID=A0A4Z2DYK9_9TELE|nr:hypothetical protein EYF80_068382 [Liparis tanakae]
MKPTGLSWDTWNTVSELKAGQWAEDCDIQSNFSFGIPKRFKFTFPNNRPKQRLLTNNKQRVNQIMVNTTC